MRLKNMTSLKYYLPRYRYKKYKNVINYGDNLQSLALKSLLRRKANISDEQIGWIVRDEMGLECPLRERGIFIPATGGLAWNTYPRRNDFPINDDKMQLLFFGSRIPEGCFDIISADNRAKEMFLKHEPIGCRDISTRNFVRELGARAYLSGCPTVSFERSTGEHKGKNVYIIADGNRQPPLNQMLPSEIWDNHVRLPGNLDAPFARPMDDNDCLQVDKDALARLATLERDAKLVITSRIHVAIPCAALGIPVVFFVDKTLGEPRTSPARLLLPTVTYQGLKNVDFNQIKPIDCGDAKSKLETLFLYRLQTEESKLGLETKRLDTDEYKRVENLLDLMCTETGPYNSYRRTSHSIDDIVFSLLHRSVSGRLLDQDAVKSGNNKIIIYGAGEFANRLIHILDMVNIKVQFLLDNDEKKITKGMFGRHEVMPANKIRKFYNGQLILLAAPAHENEIIDSLLKDKIPSDNIISAMSNFGAFMEYIPPNLTIPDLTP